MPVDLEATRDIVDNYGCDKVYMTRKPRGGVVSEDISELRELIARWSISTGKFELASGAKSSYYCDAKKTMLSPRGARLIGEIVFDRIRGLGVEAVGGLAMGSVYITSAVTMASDSKDEPIFGFTIRQANKTHGLQQKADESYHPDGRTLLAPGRRVAIVDDVLTTGGSVQKAINAVQELGCVIEVVIVIVDRKAGGEKKIRDQGLNFISIFHMDNYGKLI